MMRLSPMTQTARLADKLDYARRRADETGLAYIVTNFGHVWLDTPGQRRDAERLGDGIHAIVEPALDRVKS